MLIDKILISNIQSWKNEIIELSKDKMNIFVAQNNTGKSVLIKLLRATALPKSLDKEDRENLIRFNEPYGRFAVQFIDGSIGYTQIQRDRIIFGFAEAGKDYTIYDNPPEEFISRLGLLVDTKHDYIVNIVDGKQAMFLIDSDTKSDHSLIKMMMEYKDFNDFFEHADMYSNALNRVEERLSVTTSELKRQLDLTEFVDVTKLEQDIQLSEYLLEECNRFHNIKKLLDVTFEDLSKVKNFQAEIEAVDAALMLQSILSKIMDIHVGEPFRRELLTVCDDCSYLSEIKNVLSRVSIDQFKLPGVAESVEDIWNIHTLFHDIVPIKSVNREVALLISLVDYAKVLQGLNCIADSLEKKKLNDDAINEIYSKLMQLGKVTECHIHGKVIYNGKECIPYNQ